MKAQSTCSKLLSMFSVNCLPFLNLESSSSECFERLIDEIRERLGIARGSRSLSVHKASRLTVPLRICGAKHDKSMIEITELDHFTSRVQSICICFIMYLGDRDLTQLFMGC